MSTTPEHDDPGASAAGQPAELPPTQQPPSGADPSRAYQNQAAERLHRAGPDRMLAGVAAGLADYFDVDPTMVRIGFVALALLGGLAVPLYLAGWLLIPDEDNDISVAEELLARERAHGAYRVH
jgi:phage shock protein PspC (stress-responsive transcriptional regulator)